MNLNQFDHTPEVNKFPWRAGKKIFLKKYKRKSITKIRLKEEKKYRCLVANDDSCQLYMMDIILKLMNFEVVQAQNGFEAFELAAAAMKYQQ